MATLPKFNKRCTDGRVILPEAFTDCDGKQLPLVWQHAHNDPQNVLGNVVLENREDGGYMHMDTSIKHRMVKRLKSSLHMATLRQCRFTRTLLLKRTSKLFMA